MYIYILNDQLFQIIVIEIICINKITYSLLYEENSMNDDIVSVVTPINNILMNIKGTQCINHKQM